MMNGSVCCVSAANTLLIRNAFCKVFICSLSVFCKSKAKPRLCEQMQLQLVRAVNPNEFYLYTQHIQRAVGRLGFNLTNPILAFMICKQGFFIMHTILLKRSP